MMSSDIETEQAIALLSRRRFLQAAGATGVGLAISNFDALAAHADPIGPRDGVLVVLTLAGGNDGLNTVVPTSNGAYYDNRRGISIAASAALDIGNGFGLHPSLPYLRDLYDNGHMAIVNGVGVPGPSLSHFDAMATWMRGQNGNGSFSGWLGRWLDGVGSATPLRSVAIDPSVPLTLIGTSRSGAAVSPWGMRFGAAKADEPESRSYEFVRTLAGASLGRGALADAITASQRDAIDVGRDVAPIFATKPPESELAKRMTVAGRLIAHNVGTRVVHVFQHGFDTHSAQLGTHARLLAELDEGVRAFYAALPPSFYSRATILVVSEFGRTPKPNDGGTDHGTTNTTLLIGRPVAGGIYGDTPSFTNLDKENRFKSSIDFRSVYATVLNQVLGADANQILGGNFGSLPLFSGAAPLELPPPPPIPDASGWLMPINPERRLDTRNGLGHPRAPMGRGIEHTVVVGGVGNVPPNDVSAVVLNVTVTNPSDDSWLTVWPTGEQRPLASNLNFVAKQTVPNLVLCKMGVNSRVSFYLDEGRGDVIADVVGYYSTKGGSGYMPVVPSRLVDTRKAQAVGPRGTFDVQITGKGGVPTSGVSAVAVNITVAEPTNAGYLTVWPSGEQRPLASSLNFASDQTVPNMVVAKVGADGKISVYNDVGSAHVIVDVCGWFSASGGSPVTAIRPVRLLDTRGSGKVGPGSAIDLKVAGLAGVPDNAKAVALNVTATEPSASSYVTVWPAGGARPLASNLNVDAGQTTPNQVMVAVGAGGKVSLFNAFGSVDLIADLVGYFV
jgi:uncharacterized protein (DUF1501 family)